MQKYKVLITGATGFIGSFLVDEAINQGLEVYAGVRQGSNVQELTVQGIQTIMFPYGNKSEIVDILRTHSFDYIIHNAGATKAKTLDDYIAANTHNTITFVDAIVESGINVKKFTFISSLAATGPADFQQSGILNDDCTYNPVTQYGISKYKAEEYIRSTSDLRYIIIRPTAVYGPREKDLLSVFTMVKYHIELFIGRTPQKLTFIYVRDLVGLICKATLSNIDRKAYFATDGHVYSSEALSGNIRDILDTWTVKIRLPLFLVNIIAIFSESIAKWKGTYSILNRDKVNELKAKNWVCNVQNHQNDLSFVPKYDLRTGLKETIDWYKKNKWL